MKSGLVPKKIARVPTLWLDKAAGSAASARHHADSVPDVIRALWPIIARESSNEKLLIDHNQKDERFGFGQIADFVRNIGSIAGRIALIQFRHLGL